MATASKYGIVCTEFGEIGGDEPVFILRAQDALSVYTISDYYLRAAVAGVSDSFLESLADVMNSFLDWQENNEMKVPD